MIVTKYIAVAQWTWGVGESPEDARKQCLKAGAKKNELMIVSRNEYDDEFPWKDEYRKPLTKEQMAPTVTKYGQTSYCGKCEECGRWVKGVFSELVPA